MRNSYKIMYNHSYGYYIVYKKQYLFGLFYLWESVGYWNDSKRFNTYFDTCSDAKEYIDILEENKIIKNKIVEYDNELMTYRIMYNKRDKFFIQKKESFCFGIMQQRESLGLERICKGIITKNILTTSIGEKDCYNSLVEARKRIKELKCLPDYIYKLSNKHVCNY